MKLYKRIVIDMKTLQVIEAEEIEYDGPIAECKGSKQTSTTSYDTKYNARMAKIAERQQGIADQYFEFWKQTYKPYETAQVAANLELMPFEVAAQKEQLQTATAGAQARRKEIGLAKPVVEEYYKQALEGVDVGQEVSRARADVAQGLQESEEEVKREMSRLGVDPTSGRFAAAARTSGLEKARAVGGAMSEARRYAERESFSRASGATQTFKGGLNY